MKVRDLIKVRHVGREIAPPTAAVDRCSPQAVYQELVEATPSTDTLAVFPERQGLLIKSTVLDMSVWVVRTPLDGIALAKETGHSAILLDDVLRQRGKTAEEA